MPTVRPARPDDLARLVTIYNHYVQHSTATFDTEPASVAKLRSEALHLAVRPPLIPHAPPPPNPDTEGFRGGSGLGGGSGVLE